MPAVTVEIEKTKENEHLLVGFLVDKSVEVMTVGDGSPAKGKLLPGDKILKINGRRVRSEVDFYYYTKPKIVTIQLERQDKDMPVDKHYKFGKAAFLIGYPVSQMNMHNRVGEAAKILEVYPAMAMKLAVGDVIVSFEMEPVVDGPEFTEKARSAGKGEHWFYFARKLETPIRETATVVDGIPTINQRPLNQVIEEAKTEEELLDVVLQWQKEFESAALRSTSTLSLSSARSASSLQSLPSLESLEHEMLTTKRQRLVKHAENDIVIGITAQYK